MSAVQRQVALLRLWDVFSKIRSQQHLVCRFVSCLGGRVADGGCAQSQLHSQLQLRSDPQQLLLVRYHKTVVLVFFLAFVVSINKVSRQFGFKISGLAGAGSTLQSRSWCSELRVAQADLLEYPHSDPLVLAGTLGPACSHLS